MTSRLESTDHLHLPSTQSV